MKVSTKEVELKVREEVKYSIVLDSKAFAKSIGASHRNVRKVLSEMRKRLFIMLPLKANKSGLYILFDENIEGHQEMLEQYVKSNIKHLQTRYFNDVVKFLPIIKDQKLIKKIGQIQMILDEGEQK